MSNLMARDLIPALLDHNPDLTPEQLALFANCSEETAEYYRSAWLAEEAEREHDARRRSRTSVSGLRSRPYG